MRKDYGVALWRSLYDILSCWMVILLAIYLTINVSWWLYPVAFVLIANRLLALSLICHEGLHGNLSTNRRLNDFLGRYLCAFPTFISFTKYRRLHILHHQGVGSPLWDPDRHLYSQFPMSFSKWLGYQIAQLVTLRMAWGFITYYTEIPELLQILRGKKKWRDLPKSNDLAAFLIFQAAVLVILFSTGYNRIFLLFVTLPFLCLTQPYVLLIGGLQHGPVRAKDHAEGVSRTIAGAKWYMWLLLPLDINFHAEHHQHPAVPHYHLRKFAMRKRETETLWHESYATAVRRLFDKSA